MAFFRRPHPLREVVRQAKRWTIEKGKGDVYFVRMKHDPRSPLDIQIRYERGCPTVLFQAFLNVRFPLANPPSGLFGRLLVRNFATTYVGWAMDICESVETSLSVWARLPIEGLNARTFDRVCSEVLTEVHAFKQELRDKYRGEVGYRPCDGGAMESDMRIVDSPPTSLPNHQRYRLPGY